MILPDVNVLVHAHNLNSPAHEKARAWWDACLAGTEEIGLAWVAMLGFLRITTNRRILARPLSVREVMTGLGVGWRCRTSILHCRRTPTLQSCRSNLSASASPAISRPTRIWRFSRSSGDTSSTRLMPISPDSRGFAGKIRARSGLGRQGLSRRIAYYKGVAPLGASRGACFSSSVGSGRCGARQRALSFPPHSSVIMPACLGEAFVADAGTLVSYSTYAEKMAADWL